MRDATIFYVHMHMRNELYFLCCFMFRVTKIGRNSSPLNMLIERLLIVFIGQILDKLNQQLWNSEP